MKTKMTFEVKGVEFKVEFEGSVRELMGVNTAMVNGTQEWLDFFGKNGDRIFNMLERAVDRSANLNKRVMVKEKEVNDFEKVINPKKD